MFTSLSQNVVLSVLMEYVGIDMRGLAGLDRAVTNHSTRSDWLAVLAMAKPVAVGCLPVGLQRESCIPVTSRTWISRASVSQGCILLYLCVRM